MPVSGEIIAINEKLNDNPELVNEKPFDDGWIVRIKVGKSEELDTLLSAKSYSELYKKED